VAAVAKDVRAARKAVWRAAKDEEERLRAEIIAETKDSQKSPWMRGPRLCGTPRSDYDLVLDALTSPTMSLGDLVRIGRETIANVVAEHPELQIVDRYGKAHHPVEWMDAQQPRFTGASGYVRYST
jgi:hypothetical protein